MALIGDSKIVMMDEPTAGMDPSSKRLVWNFLKNQKHGSLKNLDFSVSFEFQTELLY